MGDMPSLAYPHLELRPGDVAYIAGTQTKVIEIVLDRLNFHWDADEIQRQHPELSLAQIYSALAYYYDHQAAMDRLVEDRLGREERILAALPTSPVRSKLKSRRRSP